MRVLSKPSRQMFHLSYSFSRAAMRASTSSGSADRRSMLLEEAPIGRGHEGHAHDGGCLPPAGAPLAVWRKLFSELSGCSVMCSLQHAGASIVVITHLECQPAL